ncbi:MAG: DNA-binding NtrC family response regulator [Verrucomicrobiales bacterium]|jgi:DNA-binding NtrC family response regulator
MPTTNQQLLIIDSDAGRAEGIAATLRASRFAVEIVADAKAGFDRAADPGISAVVTGDDLRLVRDLHSRDSRLPVIALTSSDDSNIAIETIKSGAYDCLLRPIDEEELVEVVEKAVEDSRRMSKPVEIGQVYEGQDTIVGRSRAMRQIYKELGRIAAQPVTVLIRGETGTGKELIARAIYQHGHRAHKPFIAVNCAAIPDSLLESELFGHEKGAFTGADKMRIGRFEQAHGGTLFLDEIGDLDQQLQVKLLRVLQERTIQRLGGENDVPVDVRVIAATHRSLESMVADGDFRQDLFYRLNVVSITIPPLRERREDVRPLIDYFLGRYGAEFGIDSPSIATAAAEFLSDQDWPGNIRQLQNVIRKALLASRGYTISWQDCRGILEDSEGPNPTEVEGLSQLVGETLTRVINSEIETALPVLQERFEREVYGQAIRRSGGNQAQAARWLGVSRLTLREKLKLYGMHPGEKGEG